MQEQVRIDKWLWAVRLFKTRSQASEACRKGRVSVGGTQVKPSRMIKLGDIVRVRKSPVTFSFEVLGLIEKRVGAKLAVDYVKDVTPASEMEILEMQKHMLWIQRDRGTGRPTKKERRDLDDFFTTDDYDFDSESESE